MTTNVLRNVGSLVKFSHTIFALPFAMAAVVLAAPFAEVTWTKVALIVLCIAAARTAAMAFNRLVDRDIDAENPRTKDREIPRGILSVGFVRLLVLVSSVSPSGTRTSSASPPCATSCSARRLRLRQGARGSRSARP